MSLWWLWNSPIALTDCNKGVSFHVCFCLLICTLSCLSSAHPSRMRALITSLFPTTAARCKAVWSPCQHKHTNTAKLHGTTTTQKHDKNKHHKKTSINPDWSPNLIFYYVVNLKCFCWLILIPPRFRTHLNSIVLCKKMHFSCWKVDMEIQGFHSPELTQGIGIWNSAYFAWNKHVDVLCISLQAV